MKKNRTWPKAKQAGHQWSGFFVVPKKRPNPSASSDASFGDFNAPLTEQKPDRRPKPGPTQATNGGR